MCFCCSPKALPCPPKMLLNKKTRWCSYMLMIFWNRLKSKSNQISLNVSVKTNDSRDNRAQDSRNPFKGHRGSSCFQEQWPGAVHPFEGSWWCWHQAVLWITALLLCGVSPDWPQPSRLLLCTMDLDCFKWTPTTTTHAPTAVHNKNPQQRFSKPTPLFQVPIKSHSTNSFWFLCPTLTELRRSTIFNTTKSALVCCMKVFVPTHKCSLSLRNHHTSVLLIARKADGAVIFFQADSYNRHFFGGIQAIKWLFRVCASLHVLFPDGTVVQVSCFAWLSVQKTPLNLKIWLFNIKYSPFAWKQSKHHYSHLHRLKRPITIRWILGCWRCPDSPEDLSELLGSIPWIDIYFSQDISSTRLWDFH